jgi:pimeloyl-ACP methyl ester carboxylesterase
MASSWPLQSRVGWLVMMAVIRSRRVGGRGLRGGRGVLRSRWVRPGLRSHGQGTDGDVEQIDAEPAADAPVSLASTSASVYWSGYFADPASAPPLPDPQINLACAAQSLDDMIRVSQAGELAATLRTLSTPALFIQDSESGLRAPGEQFARTLPCARVAVIKGAGHFPWTEAPGDIGDLVSSFLR